MSNFKPHLRFEII